MTNQTEREDRLNNQDQESLTEDNLIKLEYDGHSWEIGYFGEKNNRFSAYGFRQDGMYIRVTSKYESKLIAELFKASIGLKI